MSSYLGSALGDAVGSVGSFMNAPRLDAIPESDSRISSANFASTVVGDGDDIHACKCAIRELKDEIGQIRTEQSQAMDTLGQLTVTIAESLKSAMQRFEKRLMSEMDARCEALERKFSEQAKKWSSPIAASDSRAPSVEASGRSPSSLRSSPHGIKDSLIGFGIGDPLSHSNRSVASTVSEKKQPAQPSFANKFGKIAASIEQSFQSLKDGQGAIPDDASDHGSTGGPPSRVSFGGLPSSGMHRDLSDLDILSNASSSTTGPSSSLHHQAHLAKGGARAQSEDMRSFRPENARQQHQQQSKPEVLTLSSNGGRSRPVTRDIERPQEVSPPPPAGGIRADKSPMLSEGAAPRPSHCRVDKSPMPLEGLKSAEVAACLRRQPDRSAAWAQTRAGNRSPSALSPDPVHYRPEKPNSQCSNMMGAASRGGSVGLGCTGAGPQQGAAPQGMMCGQQQRASSVQGAMMGSACTPKYAAYMGRR